MEYRKEKDKIIIKGLEDFNIEQILLCGQVFRFENKDNKWIVYSLNKRAIIHEDRENNVVQISTNDVDYFEEYFDLKTSYKEIKDKLKSYNFDFLNKAIDKYSGIRILKQDIYETFFSFLISSNNNIKRIQKIIFLLCSKYGENKGEYNAFPNFETLKKLNKQDFLDIGLGYRADYFVKSLQNMEKDTLYNLKLKEKDKIKEDLMKFCGVGEKVADCVMLFGYGYSASFPCDVWIEKMYNKYFEQETNRKQISINLVKLFKELSGYAQQYLFYYIKTDFMKKK